MMKKYGDFSDLPNEIEASIQLIIDILDKEFSAMADLSIYYGYPLIELDGQETIMKACIVSRQGIIALYVSEAEKAVYNRHLTKIILDSPAISQIYFATPNKVLNCLDINDTDKIIEILKSDECLSNVEYREINAIIQNIYGLFHKDERSLVAENSLGALIKKRNNAISVLDQNQFDTIYKKTIEHTRIRGLAGSGKTILLVKKMAYMHYKYRDLELVYVFYTKSLKQYIQNLFMSFYKDFEKYQEPDMDKIHILHSWGGNEMEGFYSRVCAENGVARKGWNEARVLGDIDKFGFVCKELLDERKNSLKKLFDYVFIDEAQDFSLYFFKLVLASLKYTGKMIYAYDELQSLNDTIGMPSKRSIFEKEECSDINLSICYRTPKEILVTAHALGLGIYKTDKNGKPDIVNMMQDYSIWQAIGYNVVGGRLGYGKDVILDREEIIEYRPQECIEINGVENEKEQYTSVGQEILRLIREDDVIPEDILIIDLSSLKLSDNYDECKKVFYALQDHNEKCKMHLVNKDSALRFRRKGSIPYTTIFRAKGNEANIVFVLNVQKMSSMMTYTRNRLFTALTRAKFKAYVYGTNGDMISTLQEEYNRIKQQNFQLNFTYPTERQLKAMKTIAQNEAKNADSYEKAYKSLGDNKELTIEILKEQIGANSFDDLIKKLKEYQENE